MIEYKLNIRYREETPTTYELFGFYFKLYDKQNVLTIKEIYCNNNKHFDNYSPNVKGVYLDTLKAL